MCVCLDDNIYTLSSGLNTWISELPAATLE